MVSCGTVGNSKAGRVVLVLWAVGWFVGLVDSLRVGWLGCE